MFRVDADRAVHACDGLSRRDFLHAGTLTYFGLGLPTFCALKAQGATRRDRDINCILLFLYGGPSHLDTFDLKPDAPAEIRGPFRPIATKVPGIEIAEFFPRLAGMMDRVALIRSAYHAAPALHEPCIQLLQSGRLPSSGTEHPQYGCVVSKLKGARGEIPAHILLHSQTGFADGGRPLDQHAGYLGRAYDPFVLDTDPNDPAFQVPDLLPPEYLTAVRESRRRSLRTAIDGAIRSFETSADVRLLESSFERAYRLMSSPEARAAFDINSEPEAVRDRYGRTRFGQGCLLARRLIERGVRFVTINMFESLTKETTWDIHGAKPFSPIESYATEIGPNFDTAYTALLEDLVRRGLLETTMVLAFGEFGRKPRINPAGGRDHHPACWSVLLAGGPIQGGRVVGASDAIGYEPEDRPVTAAEIAATVYQGLGIPLDTDLPGPQGRPIRIVDHGVESIRELF
jgi:hypothetical protein